MPPEQPLGTRSAASTESKRSNSSDARVFRSAGLNLRNQATSYVLATCHTFFDRCVLSSQADTPSHLLWISKNVDTVDERRASIASKQSC